MNAQEIHILIEENRDRYGYFGLRAMTPSPITNEHENAEIGSQVENSYDWDDGYTTDEELQGVCALNLNPDDDEEIINQVIHEILQYAWCCQQIVLIGSLDHEWGNDPGEIILYNNDTVLAVWNTN